MMLLDSGEMHPYTVDGMATSEKGIILKSAVLENRLQETKKSQDTLVNHPEHVRMLCFIMKLKEIKKEHTDVYIIRLKDVEIPSDTENGSVVESMIKSHMSDYLKLNMRNVMKPKSIIGVGTSIFS